MGLFQPADTAEALPCPNPEQPLASAFVVPHPSRPNEDTFCICPVWLDVLGGMSFFGVYDGHGGSEVSRFLAASLHHYVKACGATSPDAATALSRAFQAADSALEDAALNCPSAGSTATVALLSATDVIVAHCGDSRALLCRGGQVVALTEDHRPARQDERERVLKAGCQILWNEGERVMGVLATTRAFGDRDLKQFGVTAEPEVITTPRSPDDEFLILATDGVSNVLTNQEVADVARRIVKKALERGSPRAAAIRMAASAIGRFSRDRNSKDDITVVVVDLTRPAVAQRTTPAAAAAAAAFGGVIETAVAGAAAAAAASSAAAADAVQQLATANPTACITGDRWQAALQMGQSQRPGWVNHPGWNAPHGQQQQQQQSPLVTRPCAGQSAGFPGTVSEASAPCPAACAVVAWIGPEPLPLSWASQGCCAGSDPWVAPKASMWGTAADIPCIQQHPHPQQQQQLQQPSAYQQVSHRPYQPCLDTGSCFVNPRLPSAGLPHACHSAVLVQGPALPVEPTGSGAVASAQAASCEVYGRGQGSVYTGLGHTATDSRSANATPPAPVSATDRKGISFPPVPRPAPLCAGGTGVQCFAVGPAVYGIARPSNLASGQGRDMSTCRQEAWSADVAVTVATVAAATAVMSLPGRSHTVSAPAAVAATLAEWASFMATHGSEQPSGVRSYSEGVCTDSPREVASGLVPGTACTAAGVMLPPLATGLGLGLCRTSSVVAVMAGGQGVGGPSV